jgi:hypothetical protein
MMVFFTGPHSSIPASQQVGIFQQQAGRWLLPAQLGSARLAADFWLPYSACCTAPALYDNIFRAVASKQGCVPSQVATRVALQAVQSESRHRVQSDCSHSVLPYPRVATMILLRC